MIVIERHKLEPIDEAEGRAFPQIWNDCNGDGKPGLSEQLAREVLAEFFKNTITRTEDGVAVRITIKDVPQLDLLIEALRLLREDLISPNDCT